MSAIRQAQGCGLIVAVVSVSGPKNSAEFPMFNRLFVDHPRSVDESYWQHFGVAFRFGCAMGKGALGAFVHAIIPGCCTTTGSDTVKRLNAIMVEQRRAKGEDVGQMLTVDWVI
jgi:hypothetical protein